MKRRGRNIQIWSMEKLENKIIDMRDMYEERTALGLPMMVSSCCDDVDGDMDAVCPLTCMASFTLSFSSVQNVSSRCL